MAGARPGLWRLGSVAVALLLAVGVPYLGQRFLRPPPPVDPTARPATLVELERAEREQRETALKRATPEKFAELTPRSSLWEWWDFALPGNPLRDQALTAMRQLEHRQLEAETMLADGYALPMDEFANLDLEVSFELCQAARPFLRRHADTVRMLAPGSAFGAIARRIETYLPAAQWLVERGCDCRPELMAYETTARAYPDSPERRAFLERVAQTRGAYREAPLAKRSLPEDGDADPL